MRRIESTLHAGQLDPAYAAVTTPANVSVMACAVPPNLGPRTRQILAVTEPRGHFAIMDDGGLTLIVDGEARDSPHSVNVDLIREEIERGMPLVVYGIGAGQLVTAIRSLSEKVRGSMAAPILVYEPDPGVLAAFLRAGLPMQGISIACDMEDFRAMFQHLLQGRGSVSLFHNSFTVRSSTKEAFDAFLDTVRRIVDAEQVTMNTILVRMPEWVRHVSENIDVIPGTKPLMALAGEFKNVPAFIVGAGPSLDKNGHLLRECAEKGLVFGIDVGARSLAGYGAEPHIFVAVEGADLSEHLAGIDWIDRVPRAFSLEASPAVLRTGKGPLLPWIDSNHSFVDFNANLLGAEGLPIGGSVTTAAFLMAEAFGCNPIVMIGQDLANTDGKRAAGHVLADKLAKLDVHGSVLKWGIEPDPRKVYDESDMIPDAPQWLHARVWFEQRASVIKQYNPEIQLINCTEGGSHVLGFADMPLANLLAQLKPISIDVMGKLDSVQPIWRQGVDWFRKRQVATLAPLEGAARAVAVECGRLAELVSKGVEANDQVQATMARREELEQAFRVMAAPQALFIGSVQPYLRELHEVREEATRKALEGDAAAEFFRKEEGLFNALADAGALLHKTMRGKRAKRVGGKVITSKGIVGVAT